MKFTIIALGLCFTSLGAFAQAYRWVDAQGQVHYGSTPPASMDMGDGEAKAENAPPQTTAELAARQIAEDKAKQISVSNTTEEKISKKDKTKEAADAKQATYNQVAKAEAQQRQQQVNAACDSMRKDLATFENQPRARVEVDGAIRRLTPEELNSKITELKKSINDNCETN